VIAVFGVFSTLMWDTSVGCVRSRCCSPLAVTMIASSPTGFAVSVNSTVALSPAATVTALLCGVYPMAVTRTASAPAARSVSR